MIQLSPSLESRVHSSHSLSSLSYPPEVVEHRPHTLVLSLAPPLTSPSSTVSSSSSSEMTQMTLSESQPSSQVSEIRPSTTWVSVEILGQAEIQSVPIVRHRVLAVFVMVALIGQLSINSAWVIPVTTVFTDASLICRAYLEASNCTGYVTSGVQACEWRIGQKCFDSSGGDCIQTFQCYASGFTANMSLATILIYTLTMLAILFRIMIGTRPGLLQGLWNGGPFKPVLNFIAWQIVEWLFIAPAWITLAVIGLNHLASGDMFDGWRQLPATCLCWTIATVLINSAATIVRTRQEVHQPEPATSPNHH